MISCFSSVVMKSGIILTFFLLKEFCCAAKLPKSFKKCNLKQPDLEECLMMAVQDALPQLSAAFPEAALASLEPAEVPAMTIGKGAGAVSVVQKYKNVKVYGYSKLQIDKFRFDFDKKLIHMQGKIKELRQESQYEFNGQILLLPIQGNGSNVLIMEDVYCDLTMQFIEVLNKGVKYIKIVETKLKLDPQLFRCNFENLFNGDKTLGDNINKLLNENWREIYEEIRDGYQNAYAAVLMGIANSFFAKVPLSEIFEDS